MKPKNTGHLGVWMWLVDKKVKTEVKFVNYSLSVPKKKKGNFFAYVNFYRNMQAIFCRSLNHRGVECIYNKVRYIYNKVAVSLDECVRISFLIATSLL